MDVCLLQHLLVLGWWRALKDSPSDGRHPCTCHLTLVSALLNVSALCSLGGVSAKAAVISGPLAALGCRISCTLVPRLPVAFRSQRN